MAVSKLENSAEMLCSLSELQRLASKGRRVAAVR